MLNDRSRRLLEPVVRRALHTYWRFARGLTLGVRGLVLDQDGRVFLVKHSYVNGWHLPGGGVEAGETAQEALARELFEEGNIQIEEQPQLFGVYFNHRISRRDHVPTASSRSTSCRTTPPPAPARGSPKSCSAHR
jgi:8-oxo-dGTP pyrophosphatase MutT (NUDIX family)